jgi:hypothetical protein
LKPNAGSENKLQYQQAKIEKTFWRQETAQRTQRSSQLLKEETKKVYDKCSAEYSFFK